MASTDAVVGFLQGQLPNYLEDLRTMVGIDCGSYTKPGVDEIVALLRPMFAGMGAEVQEYRQERHGDDIVGRLPGRGRARILILCHTDTVYDDGTAAARPMTVEGNIIKGPGVCDMKGGLLNAIYAVRALQRVGFRDFGEIVILCNSDEEIGERHSIELITREAGRAHVVLTMEAGRQNGDIVSARKAAYSFLLEVFGKAAHAGVEPEKGRSAILELAHKIVALHGLNGYRPGINVNVGVIAGGTRPNVVPEHARAQIDVRAVTQGDLAALEARFQQLLQQRTVPDVRFSLRKLEGNPPMEKTPSVAALVHIAQEAARQLGFEVRDAATGGGSDGCLASAAGVPTLDGLGPVGGLDHSPDEYIELDSIVPRAAMLALMIMEIGRRGGRVL